MKIMRIDIAKQTDLHNKQKNKRKYELRRKEERCSFEDVIESIKKENS